MKSFTELKCLIIDDKHDSIKGAREALINLGIVRKNIFPNNDDEQWFSNEIKEKSNDDQFPFLEKIIKENKIDFILLDMRWKKGERPPHTSGERFTFYLERSGLSKMPIVGFSIYSEAEIDVSLTPIFYIQKDSGDMPPSKVVEKFKNEIGTNALLRICNGNNKISDLRNLVTHLEDTLQEKKVIIQIFVDYAHSSTMKNIKKELEHNKVYDALSENQKSMMNSLVQYSGIPDKFHIAAAEILADENAASAIVNVIREILYNAVR